MPTYAKVVERTFLRDCTYTTDDPALPGIQVFANVRQPQTWTRALLKSGTRNPNWKVQVAKKMDASTDYDVQWGRWHPARFSAECLRTSISVSFPQWKARSSGRQTSAFSPESLIEDVHDSVLADLALTRLKRKLASESGFFNAAVPVGELRELRKTITGTLPGIKRLLVDSGKLLTGGRRLRGETDPRFASRLAQVKKDLGDVWLNFNFGIKPTLSDMEKILASIRHFLEAPPTVRIRGIAKKEWFSGNFRRNAGFSYGANVDSMWNLHHTLRYSYTGGFSFKMLYDTDYQLDDQLGLGLGGLPSVAWELHPYSWVLDYFANVGPWLDDEFVIPPGTLLFLNSSRKYHVTGDEHAHPVPFGKTDYLFDVHTHSGLMEFGHFSRTKLTTLPHIGFRLKSFDEVGKNAITKLANLASLMKLDASKVTNERVANERRLEQSRRAVRKGIRRTLLDVKTKTKE